MPLRTLSLLLTAAALGQEPTTGRLQGRVVDQRGEPVQAAEVFVTEQRLPVAVTRTDGSGTFHLPKVPFGELELHARAVGRARCTLGLALRADAPLIAKELDLVDADGLSGRVTDIDGRPIAGATVIAKSSSSKWLSTATETTTTDDDGRYQFEAVAIGGQEVTVLAAGHAVGFATCRVGSPTVLDFALLRGAAQTLHVHLRGASAALLANAVCEIGLVAGGRRLELPARLGRGTFDARGDFVLQDLPADVAFRDQRVRMPGADVRFLRAQQRGERFVVDFECEPGPPQMLRGELRGAGGKPLPGRELFCTLPGGGRMALLTGADGTFAVPSPYCRGEPVEIAPADPALALPATLQRGRLDAPFSLRTRFDPGRSLVVKTTAATIVTGSILGPDGKPAPGVAVSLLAVSQGDFVLALTYSDAAGRYRIGHVDPTIQGLQVRASGPSGAGESATFDPTERATSEVAPLTLVDQSGSVRGVVTNERGEPLAGAIVCLGREEEPAALPGGMPRRMARGMHWSNQVLTDREGRFMMRRVRPGDFRFAWLRGDASMSVVPPDPALSVQSGKVTTFDFRVK